jgi:hypothetical protein
VSAINLDAIKANADHATALSTPSTEAATFAFLLARNDIPDLLEEVTRLTAELAAANAVIATLRNESEFLLQYLAENGGSLKIGRTGYLPEGTRVQLYKMDNPAGFMAELVNNDGESIERKAHNAAN